MPPPRTFDGDDMTRGGRGECDDSLASSSFPASAATPLEMHPSEGEVIVSWNIGLRGLRQLCDAQRGAEKTGAKDEHGVSRQLGYGSVDGLLRALGPAVRVVCLQETKLSSRGDLLQGLACPDGWDSFFSVNRAPGKGAYAGTAVYFRANMRVFAAEEGLTGSLAQTSTPAGRSSSAEEEEEDAGDEADARKRSSDGEARTSAPAASAGAGDLHHYGEMRQRFTPQRLAELDAEGRALIVDFGSFVLFNLYVPAVSSEDEARVVYKADFLAAVEIRYRALLAAGRSVVLCGDWNVAPTMLDAAYAIDDSGISAQAFVENNPSRSWLARQLVASDTASNSARKRGETDRGGGGGERGAPVHCGQTLGVGSGGGGETRMRHLIDIFRRTYPRERGAYTCWDVSSGAQLTNYGSRIDYFLMDETAAAMVTRVGVAPTHQGSDHAPVFVALRPGTLPTLLDAEEISPPSLASSVALAREGRQGRLDGFLVAVRPGLGADGVQRYTAGEHSGVERRGAGGFGKSSVWPDLRATGGVKRKRKGGPGGGGGNEGASITSFFKTKGGGGLAQGSPPAVAAVQTLAAAGASTATAPPVPSPSATAGPPAGATLWRAAERGGMSCAEAVQQWKRIQQGMAPPKCKGHGETCKVRKVKEGPNVGRVFFCCPRPKGKLSDGGDCGHFKWAYGRR